MVNRPLIWRRRAMPAVAETARDARQSNEGAHGGNRGSPVKQAPPAGTGGTLAPKKRGGASTPSGHGPRGFCQIASVSAEALSTTAIAPGLPTVLLSSAMNVYFPFADSHPSPLIPQWAKG